MRRRRAGNTTGTAATISRKTLIRDMMSGCSWINGSLFESTSKTFFWWSKNFSWLVFPTYSLFFIYLFVLFHYEKKKILSCVFYCWQEPGARSLLNGWKVATFLLSFSRSACGGVFSHFSIHS
jgi:hypothetical protein